MGSDKRTATEILLSIETKLTMLEKRIQNSENLLKIQLGRLNSVLSGGTAPSNPPLPPPNPPPQKTEPAVINKENFDNRPRTNKISEMASKYGINIEENTENNSIENKFVAKQVKDSNIDPDDLVEAPIRGNVRGQRGNKSKGSKSSVSQVLLKEETPLFLANVEVFDHNGVLINQTRTNTKGRWLMALTPGDYQVQVIKRYPPDSGKSPLDYKYQISVPPSDKPLELDPLFISNNDP